MEYGTLNIRDAAAADADAGADVLRRSITDLCTADHNGDEAALKDWLANKTADEWRRWLAEPNVRVFVAEDNGRVSGVGLMTTTGDILLNYVAPEARFRGVSKALMAHMEARARDLGLRSSTLTSTRTALRFYETFGYVRIDDAATPTMRKVLA